ncbi:DUF4352 domain-containing protein [Domibacillus iocasae]|uniref:DUF4352 domain-containing protein n=1 Tax=Domibacillus iocasae TaxID=1714016 RepID=A0A1E7DRX8_9BACI|nr:DUF4352 domain-containing protein [Domibacillus iocasae]OES45779.1 hypothetical protein BA724_02940 [Domibacillus iocasae]
MKWAVKWLFAGALSFGLAACGEADIEKVSDDAVSEKTEENYKAKKKLNEEEKVALEFYQVYMKGTDAEAKEQFVSEKVYAETAPLFSFGADAEGSDDFNDLKVIESIHKKEDGEEGTLVLIHSTNQEGGLEESIAVLINGKFVMAYSAFAEDAEYRTAFEDLRSEFKADIPKETKEALANAETEEEEANAVFEETYKVGDTVSIDGTEITIKSAKFTDAAEYSDPQKGKILTLEVAVKNNGEENAYVDNTEFTISDAEGNMHEEYYGYDDTSFSNEVKVGKQYAGEIAFDVPESASYEIYYEPSFSMNEGEIKFVVTKEELQ